MVLVAKGIHGLPEPFMLICHQFTFIGQSLQRTGFPTRLVAIDILYAGRLKDKKATVDPASVPLGLLGEPGHPVFLHVEGAVPARRLHRGHRCLAAMLLVEGNQRRDIDIAQPVTIGEAERLSVPKVLPDTPQPPPGHGGLAGIDQRHLPWFGLAAVHLHFVGLHVKGHVRHVQEVIGKVLLDDIPFVTAADDEVMDAMMGIELHDVPENRPAADLDHGLGPKVSFFGDAGSVATGEDDGFHTLSD